MCDIRPPFVKGFSFEDKKNNLDAQLPTQLPSISPPPHSLQTRRLKRIILFLIILKAIIEMQLLCSF